MTSGELVALDTEVSFPPSQLHIAWRTGNRLKALRWFIEQFTGDS